MVLGPPAMALFEVLTVFFMNPDTGHEVVASKKEELRSKLSGFFMYLSLALLLLSEASCFIFSVLASVQLFILEYEIETRHILLWVRGNGQEAKGDHIQAAAAFLRRNESFCIQYPPAQMR